MAKSTFPVKIVDGEGEIGDNNPLIVQSIGALNKKYDKDGTSKIVYVGKAKAGTALSAAGWQIYKNIYDGTGALDASYFADGEPGFVHVWDDRADYTYTPTGA